MIDPSKESAILDTEWIIYELDQVLDRFCGSSYGKSFTDKLKITKNLAKNVLNYLNNGYYNEGN